MKCTWKSFNHLNNNFLLELSLLYFSNFGIIKYHPLTQDITEEPLTFSSSNLYLKPDIVLQGSTITRHTALIFSPDIDVLVPPIIPPPPHHIFDFSHSLVISNQPPLSTFLQTIVPLSYLSFVLQGQTLDGYETICLGVSNHHPPAFLTILK